MARTPLVTEQFLLENFAKSDVRLFRTQAYLFEFLDRQCSTDDWLPFSIELPSRAELLAEVVNISSSPQTCGSESTAAIVTELNDSEWLAFPSIFRKKRPRDGSAETPQSSSRSSHSFYNTTLFVGDVNYKSSSSSTATDSGSGAGEDSPLNAAAGGLSQQTRFFIAIRREFVGSFHRSLPIGEQHLYEILREHRPCHLYMDVEQEYEHLDTLASSVSLVDLESSSVVGEEAVRTLTSCDLATCRVRPNHSALTTLLLSRLQQFLREKHETSLRDEEATVFPFISLDEADVFVLTSSSSWSTGNRVGSTDTPSTSAAAAKSKKFSQHFIIRLHRFLFRDPRDVGVLIREFVLWLSHLSIQCVETHQAFFFHAKPLFSSDRGIAHSGGAQSPSRVDSSPSTSETLVVPRRCIIDTSVYSRNRMFRCYGSSKLRKEAVLFFDDVFHQTDISSQVQRQFLKSSSSDGMMHHMSDTFPYSTATDETFLQTLASFVDTKDLNDEHVVLSLQDLTLAQDVEELRPVRTLQYHNSSSSSFAIAPSQSFHALPSPYPLLDAFMNAMLQVWGDVPNAEDQRRKTQTPHALQTTQVDLRTNNSLGGLQRKVTSWSVTSATAAAPLFIAYRVQGTKYCKHVNRPHRSNGIFFVVSIAQRTFVQRCYDPDCRGFESPPIQIPLTVALTDEPSSAVTTTTPQRNDDDCNKVSAPHDPVAEAEARAKQRHASNRTIVTLL